MIATDCAHVPVWLTSWPTKNSRKFRVRSDRKVVACQDPDMALLAGDRAPAFTLVDQDGSKVKLSDLKGRKVLVYFYPKADTPGCTTQSCELSAIKDDVDVQIIGISPDAPEKQKRFDEKYSLGFPLLSDPDHVVAEKYGAWGEKSMYGKKYMGIIRSAFLIDEKGKVAEAWPKISPKDTPKKLLQALELRRP
jgi:peroxiredoxin Q/BCP